MLRRNINANEFLKIDQVGGLYIIVGNIGNGATIDARQCKLEIRGNRGDNVTFHSMGEPEVTGTRGENVTYYNYNSAGKCSVTKYAHEGDLVIGAGGSYSCSVSLFDSSSFRPKTETIRPRANAVDPKPAEATVSSSGMYGTTSQKTSQPASKPADAPRAENKRRWF